MPREIRRKNLLATDRREFRAKHIYGALGRDVSGYFETVMRHR